MALTKCKLCGYYHDDNTVVHYVIANGDNLTKIMAKHSQYADCTIGNMVKWNDIPDPNLIYAGDCIVVSGGANLQKSKNPTYTPTIKRFGLLNGQERTLYAQWEWDHDNTEKYQIRWKYFDVAGKEYYGDSSSKSIDEHDPDASKYSTYRIPDNAVKVTFEMKPISKKMDNSEETYWNANWSTKKTWTGDAVYQAPPTPTVKIENYTLTATVDNIDSKITKIEFQVARDNSSTELSGPIAVKTSHAEWKYTTKSGHEYKVRCRGLIGKIYTEWSAYSNNEGTIPATVGSITTCRAASKTSVYLEWPSVKNATSYEVEYATKESYFDGSDQTTKFSSESNHYEKTGLTPGETYYFRVRAVNEDGESQWSALASTVIGTTPIAPTTWSSTTSAVIGEMVNLYWVHNSEDNSNQTFAELELDIGGIVESHDIKNTDDEDKTSVYAFVATAAMGTTTIQWRVRTAGITREYGDWSIQRTIEIYEPPTLELTVTNPAGAQFETLESFPFKVHAVAGPNTQSPTSYHLTVVSNGDYDTVDNLGRDKTVSAGDLVYSRHFDISDPLDVDFTPGNINLENNISYTIKCVVSMNTGLTVEKAHDFTVAWTDEEYFPNAIVGIHEDTLCATIRPYCDDIMTGLPIENLVLSVYRREFDGSFTKLHDEDIINGEGTSITDPHPALDYARYRIVATSTATGAISYIDLPGVYVGCKSAIIQWDENANRFDVIGDDPVAERAWSGSMLKLPYNVDISDNYTRDTAFVEYIGRSHPVGYYGTQVGEKSSWSVVIEKDDKETLYALRRLAIWQGNVYVREPSGSGYWASVNVSYNQKHKDRTIPVTIDVTRVEGGV